MANTLGLYDPLFYANEAIDILYKALGMANAVYRGYEPSPQQYGSTIQIRKPMSFVATAMPATPTDLTPGSVSIVLDQWYGVTLGLTDKELTYTKERIIQEHIAPMAYAIADQIDQSLALLYRQVPWFADRIGGTAAIADLVAVRKIMFDNKVPQRDRHWMIGGQTEADFLNLAAFNQVYSASDGAATQRDGTLGRKFGFDLFANQNVQTHATTALASVTQMQLNAGVAKGSTTFVFKDSDGVLAGTLKAGDTFVVVGSTQRYAIAADSTAAGNLFTITTTEPAVIAYNTSDNVTVRQGNAKTEELAFHRNAFTLAMAPLSTLGDGVGAKIGTANDPVTGISLRSRVWYDGTNAKLFVGLDALWGVKCLDGNKAVRFNY